MPVPDIEPRKWRYIAPDDLRRHIANWEGSDFALQNLLYGGDAIGVLSNDFTNWIGDRYKYLTSKELNAFFDFFYSHKRKTVDKVIGKRLDDYILDMNPQKMALIELAIRDSWVTAEKKYRKGVRNRVNATADLMGLDDKPYLLPDSRTVIFPRQKLQNVRLPEITPQPVVNQHQRAYALITPTTNTTIDTPTNLLNVWDIFDRGAVAYGNQLKQLLPPIGDMISDGKNKYFAEMLGLNSIYDTGNLNYEFRPFIVAKNGKLPEFGDGEVPDSTWHEEWLKLREPQFNENLNSASGQLNIFLLYGTDSIKGQLNNLKSARVYTDSESFNNSVPDSEKLTSFARKSLLGGGEVRLGINGNNSIYLDPYSDGWVKTHEYTHALSRVPDLSDPNHQIDIMTPQDAKFALIVKEAELNNSLYADPSDIYNDEYDMRPNEKTSEIYAFRQKNKLNPKKKVTSADIEKWRKEDLIPYSLNKYSNDALVRMFNDIAYVPNQPKGDIVYAKNGKLPRLNPLKR